MKSIIQCLFVLMMFCLFVSAQQKDLKLYLKATKYINSDDVAIVNKMKELTDNKSTEELKLKAIFEFVRDSHTDTSFTSMVASDILRLGGNSCYQRSILLAALCRASGIPARLQWQKVTLKNFEWEGEILDEYVFVHGITGIYINGQWCAYEPVGNSDKWKVWVQKDEENQLEFVYGEDCLFKNTEKVELVNLPVYFPDYFEEMKTIREKIVAGEFLFTTHIVHK